MAVLSDQLRRFRVSCSRVVGVGGTEACVDRGAAVQRGVPDMTFWEHGLARVWLEHSTPAT
jgi:hypothetical protein